MTDRIDVLLYVQHLLGIGHIRRAAVLARALHQAGLKVVFVTGGLPVGGLGLDGMEVVQLPPARAQDESFAVILDEHDRPIDEAWMARRRDLLLEVYHRSKPRVVMTELYPFGRRKMRFELEPLIEAARADSPPALIACSLRDIVNRPERPEKTAWMVDHFTRQFDIVYLHGDPRFFRLEDSFPESEAVAQRLHYTGYVTEAAQAVAAARANCEATSGAENGADALTKIRANAPDFVLSDWNMPEMTGIELLRNLRGEGNETPFAFVTSEGSDQMRETAEQAGALFLIAKPFTADTFRDTIDPLLA